jgi:hypothetical protein
MLLRGCTAQEVTANVKELTHWLVVDTLTAGTV